MIPSTIRRRETLLLSLFFASYFLLWTLEHLIVDIAPPGDDFEQLHWATHLQWGYAKHPPFPTAILWVFERVFPATMTLTYVLGALMVALTMLAAWNLTRQQLGRNAAWIALLLISCNTYHTAHMNFFNHNTVLMIAVAGSLLCLWHCATSERHVWWIALGGTWGVGLLSKYQMALPMACQLLFLALALRAKPRRIVVGTFLATATTVIVIAPHVRWLIGNDFPTFRYASNALADVFGPRERLSDVSSFVADQVLRLLPLLVAVPLLMRLSRRSKPAEGDAVELRTDPLAARFWLINAWGPLGGMLLMSIIGGIDLQTHWGTAFLWTLPLWLLQTPWGKDLLRLPVLTVLKVVSAIHVVLLLVAYPFRFY